MSGGAVVVDVHGDVREQLNMLSARVSQLESGNLVSRLAAIENANAGVVPVVQGVPAAGGVYKGMQPIQVQDPGHTIKYDYSGFASSIALCATLAAGFTSIAWLAANQQITAINNDVSYAIGGVLYLALCFYLLSILLGLMSRAYYSRYSVYDYKRGRTFGTLTVFFFAIGLTMTLALFGIYAAWQASLNGANRTGYLALGITPALVFFVLAIVMIIALHRRPR